MQIEFAPADLLFAVSAAYRIVEREPANDDIGLEIQTANDGLVTFWFRAPSDLKAFVNRINQAVNSSLSIRDTA